MSPSLPLRLLQTQSDARLLAAARHGHERAFEALVQRYRKPLLRYCRRLLLPEARAEDALQQGLLQAWLALRRGAEVRDARAWLYRVVHNAAVDALRTSGYDYAQLEDSLRGTTSPDSDLERRTAIRQALVGLSALPELQREALLRTAVAGHSYEQVAAALGISDGAVRGLVYRARTSLRAAATALTPPPLVAWLADGSRRGGALAQRLGGAGAGGGAAGTAGVLVKGGAAVITAGVLVAGAASVHSHARAERARLADPARIIDPAARANSARASFVVAAHAGLSRSSRRSRPAAGGAAGSHFEFTGPTSTRENQTRRARGAQPQAVAGAPEKFGGVGSSAGEAHAASAASAAAAPAEAPAPPAGGAPGGGGEGATPQPPGEPSPGGGGTDPGDSLEEKTDDGAGPPSGEGTPGAKETVPEGKPPTTGGPPPPPDE
jgi:RNA polymerase sigma factor (sigma-70 family)